MKKLIVVVGIFVIGFICEVYQRKVEAQVFIRSGSLGQTWTCSLAGLAATLTECQALSAGRKYYITDVFVGTTTSTSGSYAIQSGTGTNCGSNTTAVFPVNSTSARFLAPVVANASAMASFTTPIPVTVSHAVCVIGTATNTINIQIAGFFQ